MREVKRLRLGMEISLFPNTDSGHVQLAVSSRVMLSSCEGMPILYADGI